MIWKMSTKKQSVDYWSKKESRTSQLPKPITGFEVQIKGINDVIIRIPHNHNDQSDGLSNDSRKFKKQFGTSIGKTFLEKISFCFGSHYYFPFCLSKEREYFFRAVFGNYYEENGKKYFQLAYPQRNACDVMLYKVTGDEQYNRFAAEDECTTNQNTDIDDDVHDELEPILMRSLWRNIIHHYA